MSSNFLIVEEFLHDALQSRALQAAFDLGIVDLLSRTETASLSEIVAAHDCDQLGAAFLMQMLAAADVVVLGANHEVYLTERFRQALPFRDLLTAKLRFAQLVAADYFDGMPKLLESTEAFMASSKLFEFFDYSRCIEVSMENCMRASQWMQLTTMLTRYEAPVCGQHYAFDRHTKMLDVGGNSGEFALQICRRNSHLKVQVMDLPVVCHVGRRHVASEPEAERLSFVAGNMLEDDFTSDADLITWKSVLHDWPDEHAKRLLQKSFDALPSGGSVLIFERESWDFQKQKTSYGLLPVLLFFRSYRQPNTYAEWLRRIGFSEVHVQQIQLEVPFLLITAKKPLHGHNLAASAE